MNDPQQSRVFTVIEPRRRGRPRVDEPRSSVSTWIPTRDHDRLIQLANAGGMSVSELVRKMVSRQIKTTSC